MNIRYPLAVRVIWPKKPKGYRYENRFYTTPDEAHGGLRWLDKMERQSGALHRLLRHGEMAPWVGCDGKCRLGHSGDVVTMLDDLERAAG